MTRSAIERMADGFIPDSTKAVTAAWIWSRRSRSDRGAKARRRASAQKDH